MLTNLDFLENDFPILNPGLSSILILQANGGNADSSGLGELYDSLTDHLTVSHITFLKQWDRLIDLEAKELQVWIVELLCYLCCWNFDNLTLLCRLFQFSKSSLWQSNIWKDEPSPTSLPSLVLDRSDDLQLQKDKLFVYRFVRQGMSNIRMNTQEQHSQNGVLSIKSHLDCALRSGDHVVLTSAYYTYIFMGN